MRKVSYLWVRPRSRSLFWLFNLFDILLNTETDVAEFFKSPRLFLTLPRLIWVSTSICRPSNVVPHVLSETRMGGKLCIKTYRLRRLFFSFSLPFLISYVDLCLLLFEKSRFYTTDPVKIMMELETGATQN